MILDEVVSIYFREFLKLRVTDILVLLLQGSFQPNQQFSIDMTLKFYLTFIVFLKVN